MKRPRGKWIAVLCGLPVLGILLAGAVYWRDFVAWRHLSRLNSDPDYLVVMLQRSDDLIARTALERFARSEAGRQTLLGTYLRWVRDGLEEPLPPSPFPSPFRGLKSGVFVVSGSGLHWSCQGADGSGGGSVVDGFERIDLLQRLNQFLPLLSHKEVVLRDERDWIVSVVPMKAALERTELAPGFSAIEGIEDEAIAVLVEDRHVRLNPDERISGPLDHRAVGEFMKRLGIPDDGSVIDVANPEDSERPPRSSPEAGTLFLFGDSQNITGAAAMPAAKSESEAGQGEPSTGSFASESLVRRASQGDLTAMVTLASEYSEGRNGEDDLFEAAKWWRRAAEGGSALAMRSLAMMYDFGYVEELGLDQQRKRSPNPEQALKWDQKAADEGDSEAMSSLGLRYTFGAGVAKNASEAIRWFKKAADHGNTAAMLSLGFVYTRPSPYEFAAVPADFRAAAGWFEKAAKSGDTLGMYYLADLLYEGRPGLPADRKRAREWMQQAQEHGHLTAGEWLEARR